MEDILTVVDGRSELMVDLANTLEHVRGYLREEFDALLSEPDIIESINWHLPGDSENQARSPIIIERIRLIAEL